MNLKERQKVDLREHFLRNGLTDLHNLAITRSYPNVGLEHVLDNFCRRTSGPSGYSVSHLYEKNKF